MLTAINLKELQQKILEAKVAGFRDMNATYSPSSRALNVCEEAGELAREERRYLDGLGFSVTKAHDAVGDIFIALCGYCISRGWDLETIVEDTWKELSERWSRGQLTGE